MRSRRGLPGYDRCVLGSITRSETFLRDASFRISTPDAAEIKFTLFLLELANQRLRPDFVAVQVYLQYLIIVRRMMDIRIRVYGSGSSITLLSSVILRAAVLQAYNHVLWMFAWALLYI